MSKFPNRSILLGLIVALVSGVTIWGVSSFFPWMDPLVAGIVGGMLLGSIIGERKSLMPGLKWAPKALIPPGIILYGAKLNFGFTTVSPLIWLQLIVGMVVVVLLARAVGKWLKLPDATSLLLAVGSAICGASAIVIASDTVGGTKRDTTSSLLVITFWGLIGLSLLPILANLLDMSVSDQALLYATTLHQTGMVKAAAMKVGGDCLSIATAIKTARIVMIIPMLFIVGTLRYFPYHGERPLQEEQQEVKIPWYLWGFILCGLCFSFITPLKSYAPQIAPVGSLIWTMAMVSIGLTVNAREVISSVGKPLIAGLVIWLGLLAVFFYTYVNG